MDFTHRSPKSRPLVGYNLLTHAIYFHISRIMEIDCITQLSALAHENRLAIFRLLVRRYPDAVPAGEIATALNYKANTSSAYLSSLMKAGLITQSRRGNSLLYMANLDGLRGMFRSLLTDCCNNRPDVCLTPEIGDAPKPSPHSPLKVLFVCTANSARSVMAEALLNDLGQGSFQAYSAGTTPGEGPDPAVLNLLSARGHDTSRLSSKSLADFNTGTATQMDFTFTVCNNAANEECPAWPGQPISAHWGMEDPLKAAGNEAEKQLALQQAYGILKQRIQAFIALPYSTLDRISLQQQSDSIGTIETIARSPDQRTLS
ncbi:transcriptional regulator/arsenate reductase [Roseobacter sp. SK209-2-6]|nr:transcriptional regulator/arsenate reductase [Roseobacter sp. SK209-2-6]